MSEEDFLSSPDAVTAVPPAPRRSFLERHPVLAALALLTVTGVSMAMIGFRTLRVDHHRPSPAEIRVQEIRSAVSMFLAENPAGGCPTANELRERGYLTEDQPILDTWGRPFDVDCAGPRITVTSAGPDGVFGTKDDIR